MVEDRKTELFNELDLNRLAISFLSNMVFWQEQTFHNLGIEEVPGGYAWVLKPDINEYITTNRLYITKSLNDISSPVPVRMVSGTAEEPAYVSVSAGTRYNVINAALGAGTVSYDIVNTIGLLGRVANSVWIETDQATVLTFNNETTVYNLAAGDRLSIRDMAIRIITVTTAAAATNIVIWCDD